MRILVAGSIHRLGFILSSWDTVFSLAKSQQVFLGEAGTGINEPGHLRGL
jgi:hypothetical protein